MQDKQRIDLYLFEHGLAESREKARALIMSGEVFVNGQRVDKAGTAIAAREGHPISWGRYCKYSAPAAVIVVAISMAVILLRY